MECIVGQSSILKGNHDPALVTHRTRARDNGNLRIRADGGHVRRLPLLYTMVSVVWGRAELKSFLYTHQFLSTVWISFSTGLR